MKQLKNILPILVGSFLSTITSLEAQQSFGGKPKSFTLEVEQTNALRAISAHSDSTIPLYTVTRQRSAESLRAAAMKTINSPMIAGEAIAVDYNLIRDGIRTELADGSVTYRMQVKGVNAKSIYLFFSHFEIPRGGKLYVYNVDRSTILGAYTDQTNPSGGEFAIEPIRGEELILEYEAPRALPLPRIVIDAVGYLYYDLQTHAIHQKAGEDEERTGCQVDANCEQGDGWDDQKNSIVQILLKKGNQIEMCSGTLLNNTNEDFAPYIVTAGHCAAHREGTYNFPATDLNRWVFTFHYIKPNCSRSSVGSIEAKSLVGCTKLAYLPMHEYSDGMLLKLNQDIPLSYRVYYSGWDRQEQVPDNGVSLHHPLGDAMKIAVFDKKPRVGKWDGYNKGAENAYLVMTFTHGETEGGSSGGSLFDSKTNLLVGTLTGGQETLKCLPNSESFYGRLAYHWDKFKDKGADKRMDIYLDPKTQGQAVSLKGTYRGDNRYLYPVTKVEALRSLKQKNLVQLTWHSPKDVERTGGGKLYYDIRRGEVILERIGHVAGKSEYSYVDDVNVKFGADTDLAYSVRTVLVHDNGRTEWTSWSEPVGVYLEDLIQEIKPQISGSMLQWQEPTLYQEWTRVPRDAEDSRFAPIPISYIPKHEVQIARQSTIKFAEKWPIGSLYHTKDLPQYAPAYITQIKVLPRKAGERFKINLDHGNGPVLRRNSFADPGNDDKLYKRSLEVSVPSDWKSGWHTVKLETPLRVYPEYMLRVGFETANSQKPSSMAYMQLEETNQRYRFVGPLVMASVNSREEWYQIYFMSRVHNFLPDFWQGNMAFRLIVSNSNTPVQEELNTDNINSYSSALPALPRPVAYDIYRQGEKEGTVEAEVGKQTCSYTPKSTELSSYVVRPIYEGVPSDLAAPKSRKEVAVTISNQGPGRVKLYGYPNGTKAVREKSVIWLDAYPNEGYSLTSLVVNGKEIYPSSEVWVGSEPLNVVAKFEKAKDTGVDALAPKVELSVYPNPVRHEALVEGVASNSLVKVYSLDGRLMHQVESVSNSVKINATQWPAGMYFIQTEDGRSTKFVVE
ncbi:MAG: T9SS type A sorting domain-containing protein [Porphyromonadaceae bacterium]|nr:T9SS type A sorting domain-containing protein [Porphyromonadaceae bacterium]